MNHNDRRVHMVTIEISGRCNASCPYCAQRRLKLGKNFGGIMTPVLFEQIVDHLFEIQIISRANPPWIDLYNFGEPFLNPGINEILDILKKKKLFARISSNFILRPEIDNENLSVIGAVTFSLSGFTQNSYDRVHGASLERVLNNFDSFYKKIREYSPKTSFKISWHRYLFNEEEFWDACRYFDRPAITFSPVVAFLNDLPEMLDFLRGRLSEDRRRHAELDLFLDHIRKAVNYCSTISQNYRCPSWDFPVIDETGQLLLCCSVTRYDYDYILGNVLAMSAQEIWELKSNNQLCIDCLSSGFVLWAFEQEYYQYQKPWPSGGGLCGLKLWSRYNYDRLARLKMRSMLRSMLLRLPKGRSLVNALKSFEKLYRSYP